MFDDDFEKDPVGAMRDFGACPPTTASPLITDPNNHIKDRIIYRGQVFTPTRVIPRGSFGYRWAVITVDLNQVNPEEMVNDPQFQRYATPVETERRTLGYGYGNYGSDPYGE
jgi:hypothetical protein